MIFTEAKHNFNASILEFNIKNTPVSVPQADQPRWKPWWKKQNLAKL